MVRPVVPGEKRIEWREKQSQPDLRAKANQIVPQCHHRWTETAGRALQMAFLVFAIFEHEAQAGDPTLGQPAQMALYRRQIAPADQTIQFRPGDRIVLTYRRPRQALI